MSSFEHKPISKLHIENIKTLEGNEVSHSPERGEIITSLNFKGKEILYFDEATFQNIEENVKGGIPILFPNAGPLEGPQYPNLKQHGFARNQKWEAIRIPNGFIGKLRSNDSTREMFPFDFSLHVSGEFKKDGSFNIIQSVKNLEKDKELPISMGLHPYFKVPNELNEDSYEQKKKIKFNFKGGDFVEENIEKWANGKAISIDNPNTSMEIGIPLHGTLVIEASKEYQKIWIWSQPGKDFICIEPVMRDKGGLVNDPEEIKPGEIFSANFNISFRE